MRPERSLGYDHGRPPRLRRAVLVRVAAGLIVAAVLVITVLTTEDDPSLSRPGATAEPTASTPATPGRPGSETPTAPQLPTENTDATPADVGSAAEATATVFLDGWLSTEPSDRAYLLASSATPDLARGLASTDPAQIPKASVSGLVGTGGSATSAEFVATLDDGTRLVLGLVTDPEASQGWLVARIDRWD